MCFLTDRRLQVERTRLQQLISSADAVLGNNSCDDYLLRTRALKEELRAAMQSGTPALFESNDCSLLTMSASTLPSGGNDIVPSCDVLGLKSEQDMTKAVPPVEEMDDLMKHSVFHHSFDNDETSHGTSLLDVMCSSYDPDIDFMHMASTSPTGTPRNGFSPLLSTDDCDSAALSSESLFSLE